MSEVVLSSQNECRALTRCECQQAAVTVHVGEFTMDSRLVSSQAAKGLHVRADNLNCKLRCGGHKLVVLTWCGCTRLGHTT